MHCPSSCRRVPNLGKPPTPTESWPPMPDTARRWWTWPRILFAVWSHILTAWTTFALTTHSMPRKLPTIMWVLVIVAPIVAVLGEVIYLFSRRPVAVANPARRRDVESVISPDVDPARRHERTAHIPIAREPNGAPRQRVAAAAPVSHGTEYRSKNCEPEPKPKKPKRIDVPPVDLSEKLGGELEAYTKGWVTGRHESEPKDPPADGPVEDRP